MDKLRLSLCLRGYLTLILYILIFFKIVKKILTNYLSFIFQIIEE